MKQLLFSAFAFASILWGGTSHLVAATTIYRTVAVAGAFYVETNGTKTTIKPINLALFFSLAPAFTTSTGQLVFNTSTNSVEIIPKSSKSHLSPVTFFSVVPNLDFYNAATKTYVKNDTISGGSAGIFNGDLNGQIYGRETVRFAPNAPAVPILVAESGMFFGNSTDPQIQSGNGDVIVRFTYIVGQPFFQQ